MSGCSRDLKSRFLSKNHPKKLKRVTVKVVMMRTIGISFVGALMAGQLMLLTIRTPFSVNTNDYPRMKLPVAANFSSHRDRLYHEDISWTQRGGWVVAGKGIVKDQDLDDFLRLVAHRGKQGEYPSAVRVRIPADAPSGIFVNLAKRMQQAGVEYVSVAVVEQRLPRLL